MSIPSLEKNYLIHTTILIFFIIIIHILYLVGKEKEIKKPCSDGLITIIENDNKNKEKFNNKISNPTTTKRTPTTTKPPQEENLKFYNCYSKHNTDSQESKNLNDKIKYSYRNASNSFVIAIVNILIISGLLGILKKLFRHNNSLFGKNELFKYLDVSLYIKKINDYMARTYNYKYVDTILFIIVFAVLIIVNIFYANNSIVNKDLLDELSVVMYAIFFTIIGLTSFFLLITIPLLMNKSITTFVLSVISFIILIFSCVLQYYNIDMINNLRKGDYKCKINVDKKIVDNVLKLTNKCVIDNNNYQLLLGLNISLIIISGLLFFYIMYKLSS